MGHFDPDLMRTYQEQYSVCQLVYHRVEESWYQELSQIRHSACVYVLCLCLCASENQAKGIIKFFSSVTV